MSDETKRPTFERHLHTNLIYQRISKASVGERIAYSELTDLIAQDVQTEGRGYLESARRIALRDDAIVFDVIRNEGIIRLDDQQIIDTSDTGQSRIRNVARKFSKLIAAAEYEKLDPQHQVKHNTNLSILGTIISIMRPKSVKQIEAAVTEKTQALGLAETLEHFKKS